MSFLRVLKIPPPLALLSLSLSHIHTHTHIHRNESLAQSIYIKRDKSIKIWFAKRLFVGFQVRGTQSSWLPPAVTPPLPSPHPRIPPCFGAPAGSRVSPLLLFFFFFENSSIGEFPSRRRFFLDASTNAPIYPTIERRVFVRASINKTENEIELEFRQKAVVKRPPVVAKSYWIVIVSSEKSHDRFFFSLAPCVEIN